MMENPSSAFRHGTRLVACAALLALGSCKSSFFQIHPEGNVTPAQKPTTGAAPAEKPVEAPVAALPQDPEPEAGPSDSAGVAKLAALAMVWHTVSLHHPDIASRADEWDGMLVRTFPSIRAARDANALAAAYAALLAPLGDGLTRVERVDATRSSAMHAPARTSTLADGTIVLALPPSERFDAADSAAVAGFASARAPRVVIDLRGNAATSEAIDVTAAAVAMNAFTESSGLVESIIAAPLDPPGIRTRRTGGSGDVLAMPRGGGALIPATRATSGWLEQQGASLTPRATRAPRIAVIANAASVIPHAVAALIAASRAGLVVEDRISDESLVPSVRVPVAPGLAVRVRTGEMAGFDNLMERSRVIVRPASASDSARAMDAALELVRNAALTDGPGASGALARARRPRFPAGSANVANDSTPYPFMGARLLAGFRVWSVMRARHGHRDSYDDDVDALFERTIPRLEAARNRQEYGAALGDLVVSFDDSQTRLHGTGRDLARSAAVPFHARVIEGRAMVTSVQSNGVPGIAPGAEITSIDGYPLAAWLLEHRRDVVASNDWTRSRDLLALMPAVSGNAPLRIREATGGERVVQLMRANGDANTPSATGAERSVPPVSRPAADIAYLDLDRVNETDAAAAISAAADARAIILDLRGRAPSWPAVMRLLAVKPEFVVARVVRRALSAPCTAASLREAARMCPDERTSMPVVVRLDRAGTYRGRVVALVDERTQGDVEQFALALEAGANATLVGSSSAGAAADTVSMPLPGGLSLSYPPEEIRRADGGQLHRTGLTPTVEARPTVRGFRAGKDEVLDRAVTWVQGLDAARRR